MSGLSTVLVTCKKDRRRRRQVRQDDRADDRGRGSSGYEEGGRGSQGLQAGPIVGLVANVLTLVLVGWRAVTLARPREIRTLSKPERKLLRSPFGFQNCTKTTKYEALEKNVVSNGKLPSLRQSLVRSFS
jgi:hypothetical protein